MVELAEIFRLHGPQYRHEFGDRMLPSHHRAMRDIEQCRTPALGGSLYTCPNCPDVLMYSYHSCGNRACPKCGNEDTTAWIEAQRQLLLPVDYHLVTYTLPEECRPVARSHQRQVYGALFRASAKTFKEVAAKNRHLGGLVGMLGVLQTWKGDLGYHPHVHYLVPAGALSPDRHRWRPAKTPKRLLPVQSLSARFRNQFRRELHKLGLLGQVPRCVWDRKWVVHSQPAGRGPEVLRYLAPYVYRVALSNRRIEQLHHGHVTFRYKNSDRKCWLRATLPAAEFIRRFLQHVLPRGFVKIRYYGFLHPKIRNTCLPIIRELLAAQGFRSSDQDKPAPADVTADPDAPRCPKCGSPMRFLGPLRRDAGRACADLPHQRGPPR